MISAFSWQNSSSLCPASFRIPRPNLPVTPGVSWLPCLPVISNCSHTHSFDVHLSYLGPGAGRYPVFSHLEIPQGSAWGVAAVTICSDSGSQENKICHCFHFFPFYLPWSDRADPIMLVFWVLSFKLVFSLSFSPSSRGSLVSLCFAIRAISTEYLRLLNGMQK